MLVAKRKKYGEEKYVQMGISYVHRVFMGGFLDQHVQHVHYAVNL